jgi:redox-regulated HSP33 family molecular chaperone
MLSPRFLVVACLAFCFIDNMQAYLLRPGRLLSALGWSRRAHILPVRASSTLSSESDDSPHFGVMLSGMSENNDISVKIVSFGALVRQAVGARTFTKLATHALADGLMGAALLASNLKDGETVQLNVVGNSGLQRLHAAADDKLRVRAAVAVPTVEMPEIESKGYGVQAAFGDGELQVIKNHASYKEPQKGIVAIRNADMALNLGFYMSESEQRHCAILTQVLFLTAKLPPLILFRWS